MRGRITMSETDFSKTLRKRLSKQPKQQIETQQPIINSQKVAWIIENYGYVLEEIVKVTARYKVKYGVPEGEKIEVIEDYEEERLWYRHHNLIDYVRDKFAEEYSCSKETTLQHVLKAISEQRKRMTENQINEYLDKEPPPTFCLSKPQSKP